MSELLDELLELGDGPRAARLAALAAEDAGLAAEVGELLAREREVERGAFLEGGALEEVAGASLAGRELAGYALEHPIGQGGRRRRASSRRPRIPAAPS